MKIVAPYKIPALIRKMLPGLTWNIPSEGKIAYLTFDDGPVPGVTEFVLDMLGHYKAQATFFCVGDNVRKHPDLFRRIVESGHAVGNHTYNHLNGWRTGTGTYVDNVANCTWEMETAAPKTGIRLFRPPYGKIKPAQASRLKELYKIVMWSVLANDFNRIHGAKESAERVKKHIESGSIIVFHDNLKAESKLRIMLPEILSHLSRSGYQLNGLEPELFQ